MKARLKRGKVISGRLADIFVSRKLAEPIKAGRPQKSEEPKPEKAIENKEPIAEEVINKSEEPAKKTRKQTKK